MPQLSTFSDKELPDFRESCRAATSESINMQDAALTTPFYVDGVAVANNDRVLVKDQVTTYQFVGTATVGTNTITAVPRNDGTITAATDVPAHNSVVGAVWLAVNQAVTGPGIPVGTTITAISPGTGPATITLSQTVTASGTGPFACTFTFSPENGVYVRTANAWRRVPDFNTPDNIFYGACYLIRQGQAYLVNGTITAASPVVTLVVTELGGNPTRWLRPGMKVSINNSNDVVFDTTIASIDSPTQITLSKSCAGTGPRRLVFNPATSNGNHSRKIFFCTFTGTWKVGNGVRFDESPYNSGIFLAARDNLSNVENRLIALRNLGLVDPVTNKVKTNLLGNPLRINTVGGTNPAQELAELVFPDGTVTELPPETLPADSGVNPDAARTIRRFQITFPPGGGSSGILGNPTDGSYGDGQNTPGVADGDRVEDAFDKIISTFDKLLPLPPRRVSDTTLTLPGSYVARRAGAVATLVLPLVTDDVTPTLNAVTVGINGFADANAGTLTTVVDGADTGDVTLTPASDVGTYGDLSITFDGDPYAGVSGKENFYQALRGGIQRVTPLAFGPHDAQLVHTTTGSTPALSFFVDNPTTPTIITPAVIVSGATRRVSGVPAYTTGAQFSVDATIESAVGEAYNNTRVANVTSAVTDSQDVTPANTPYAVNADIVLADIELTVAAGRFSMDAPVVITGYNSKGDPGALTVNTGARVDSISNETSRVRAGAGLFPFLGPNHPDFSAPFDVNELLSVNEELQVSNATFRFPPAVNYATANPVGPDYSALPAGIFQGYRWACVKLGPINNQVFTVVNLLGLVGATLPPLGTPDMVLQVRVDGASPTGWLDANAPYPGVGNPTVDGSPAMVLASSTVGARRVTFGTVTRTGDVYLRVGLKASSGYTFTGLSLT
jgi:hypothetical protein